MQKSYQLLVANKINWLWRGVSGHWRRP